MRAATIRAVKRDEFFPGPSNFGGMLSLLMAQRYYPEAEEEGEKVQTSVRLPTQQHEDILLIADLWNELDKVLGRRRPRKWKPASVIERLIAVGIEGFWGQIGGRPETEDDRKAALAKAVELARERSKK